MDKTKAQVDELSKILNSNLDLEAKIEKIESLRVQYAMKGKYDEAKLCAAKTKELKGNMKTNKKVDLEEQHKSESENLEQQFQQELENLNISNENYSN